MMPLYVAMFIIPMNNLSLPNNNNPILILLGLLKQIIINPWMTSIFILSFLASAAQSANTPNWLALITDVNLPEHRGTAFSIANLANGLGRTIGNARSRHYTFNCFFTYSRTTKLYSYISIVSSVSYSFILFI